MQRLRPRKSARREPRPRSGRTGHPDVRPRVEAASSQNKQFCATWFFDNFSSRFEPRLIEHIELTAIAVGVGMVIAFTAAILAYKLNWFETPFSLVSAFLYTIPSLALFELLVPITGINRFTAEIGLVSYTLLILFRNTLTGLRGVPQSALEAARAMGFTSRQQLIRVELPLALPGDHGRHPDRHRDDDQPDDGRGLHRRRRSRARRSSTRSRPASRPSSSPRARSRCCSRSSPTCCSS